MAKQPTALVPPCSADALLNDLSAWTQIRAVRVWATSSTGDDTPAQDLAGARAALLAGRVLGVQVRYGYDGLEWCDTFVREGKLVRVVRLVVPPSAMRP